MKTHTQTYKENLVKLGKEIDAKVIYTINGVQTELDGDMLGSVTPHYEGAILKSVMKQVDIVSDIDIPLNTEINVQFGLKFDDENYEYVDYGNYIVFSSEKQEDTNNYKIIAYDKMLYAMKDYEQFIGTNLFDKETMIINSAIDSSNGNMTESDNFRTIAFKCKPSTTYTIKKILSNRFVIGYSTDDDTNMPKTLTNIQGSVSHTSETFTTNNDTNYVFIMISKITDDTTPLEDLLNSIQIQEGTSQEIFENIYPITIRDYLNILCTKLNLEFANSNDTFTNYDKEITQELYKDLGYTYRDVLDELAQVTASTICINEDDELEVRYINDTQSLNIYSGSNDLYSNIRDIGQFTKENLENNQLKLTKVSNGTTSPRFYVSLTQGETYTISCKVKGNATKCIIGYWLDSVMTEASTITPNEEYQQMYFTFTYSSGSNPRIFFRNGPQTFSSLNQYIIIKDFMIEKGNVLHEYELYGADCINEDYIKNTRADFGEKYGPINSIVLSRSADTDNVYIQDEESIEENGLCEIKIKDNQILNDNDRSDFLPGLLERLDGIEYYTNNFESIGITYLDLCDKYNVKIEDKFYNCIMFNNEVEIGDGLNEIIYTNKPEITQTDYKKASKTDKQERQTYLIVDKQNEKIEALVGDIDGEFASINFNVNGISSRVQTLENDYSGIDGQISGIRQSITTQTATAITDWFNLNLKTRLDNVESTSTTNNEEIIKIQAYIRRGVITDTESPYYNQAYVEIGDDTNETTLRILKNRIQFLTNGVETAFISNNQLYINESTILTKEKVGHWVTTEDDNGLLNTYWEE